MTQQGYSGSEPRESETDDDGLDLAPSVQAMIGRQLKAHYDDLVTAPIADTIMLLLAQLEAKESGGSR